MSVEFTRYRDGTCAITDGQELLWSSDGDDEFLEEFDATIDSEDIDDVLDWLQDNGYVSPDGSADIVEEDDTDTMSVQEDDDYEDNEDDEDEQEEEWRH